MRCMRVLKILSVVCAVVSLALFGITYYPHIHGADDVPPQISMDQEEIEIPVEAAEPEILQGVTAADAEDGDVTDSLLVEGLSPFVAEGERIATIVAFDSENHLTKATRTVHYTNYKKPKFSLSAPLSFAAGSNQSSLIAAMSAWDCLDGDVTRRITRAVTDGTGLSMDVAGEYPVTFSVSNSAGDVEKFTATVEIYDASSANPLSIALTDALLYIPRGSAFDPKAYVESIAIGGTVYLPYQGLLLSLSAIDAIQKTGAEITPEDSLSWNSVQIENPVDTQTPGWYEVAYKMTFWGDETKTTRLLVRVEE